MSINHKKDLGFSTIVTIALIIIAIGLISTGWMIYININKPSAIVPTTEKTPIIVTPSNEFKIPELGIKFILPDDLTGLKYIVKNNTDGSLAAFFTTSVLEQMDGATSQCSASNGAIGAMSIVPKTGFTPDAAAFKLVGGSYAVYQQPQSSCASNAVTGNFQLSQIQSLKGVVDTITLIK